MKLYSGIVCMILAHIPTLQGGAWNEFTVLKQNRITAIATENHLPLIALVQSVSSSICYLDKSIVFQLLRSYLH